MTSFIAYIGYDKELEINDAYILIDLYLLLLIFFRKK